MTEAKNKGLPIFQTIPLFSKFTALFLIVLLVSFWGIFQYTSSKIKNDIILKENFTSLLLNRGTSEIIKSIKSDITFLSKQVEQFYIFEKTDFDRHLAETFYEYSVSKKIYDQIRFIDCTGQEKVRVNLKGNNVSVVPKDQLQNKSSRYYFTETMKIGRDSVYFSVLDLNVEFDKIEIPYKPMIRIGSPVFDQAGNKIGIVVVNFLAGMIIDEIRNENGRSLANTLLINKKGYYFMGLSSEDEWGFMFPDKKDKTFFNDFPSESEIIYSKNSGSFSSPKGLFVYSTIIPQIDNDLLNQDNYTIESGHNNFWKIISFIPKETINKSIYEKLNVWIKIIIVISIAIIFLLWILARNIQYKQLAYAELKSTNTKLYESNATKDKFFSIIAHDLRSPFQSLLGLSELLNKDINEFSKDEIIYIADSINKTAKITFELLENLLNWSRLQTGNLLAIPSKTSLHEQLNRLESLVSEPALNKGIKLNIQLQNDIQVYADRQMLNTVMRNLVSNAIKFTPKGGTITISYSDKPKFVELAFADTGLGMDSETLNSLFHIDKVKSKNGTENEKGTGLGLLLCKEFIEKNNGTIQVLSEPGKGSTFMISIPKADEI